MGKYLYRSYQVLVRGFYFFCFYVVLLEIFPFFFHFSCKCYINILSNIELTKWRD